MSTAPLRPLNPSRQCSGDYTLLGVWMLLSIVILVLITGRFCHEYVGSPARDHPTECTEAKPPTAVMGMTLPIRIYPVSFTVTSTLCLPWKVVPGILALMLEGNYVRTLWPIVSEYSLCHIHSVPVGPAAHASGVLRPRVATKGSLHLSRRKLYILFPTLHIFHSGRSQCSQQSSDLLHRFAVFICRGPIAAKIYVDDP
jgi:hypothetical protein